MNRTEIRKCCHDLFICISVRFLYRLTKVWEELFHNQLLDHLSTGQCPMLIGIMQRPPEEMSPSSTSEYQLTSLLETNTLPLNQTISSCEAVLHKLTDFKAECDNNEQALVSI
jgi:hypothetical protein